MSGKRTKPTPPAESPSELRRLQLFFALLIGGLLGFVLLQIFGRGFMPVLILVPVLAIALARYPAQFFYQKSKTGRNSS